MDIIKNKWSFDKDNNQKDYTIEISRCIKSMIWNISRWFSNYQDIFQVACNNYWYSIAESARRAIERSIKNNQ